MEEILAKIIHRYFQGLKSLGVWEDIILQSLYLMLKVRESNIIIGLNTQIH